MADGIFVVRCDYSISWIHWGYGAALSFILHIMLNVVVLLPMVPIVVRSMLMRTMVLVLAPGAALSFKLIASYYYIRHGGFSNCGTPCGAFCVHALYAFSDSGWSVGTALSFKPIYNLF